MPRIVSFIALIAIILVFGFLFFRVMAPFLLPLVLAALLVVIFEPLHRRVVMWCRGRTGLAAAATTGLVIAIVLLPLLTVLFIAAAEGSAVVARFNPADVRDKLAHARDQFALLRLPHAALLRDIESRLQALANAPSNPSLDPAHLADELAQIEAAVENLRQHQTVTTAQTAPAFDALQDSLRAAAKTDPQATDTRPNRDALHRASRQFHELKLVLLGGPFRTWIKELANPTEEEIQQTARRVLAETQGWLFSIGGRTTALAGRVVIGLMITIVAMYFFWHDGPGMVATVMRLSPLDDRYERELLADFTKVSRAVVLATLASALVQGLLGGIGYYLAGFHAVVLLTVLTGLLAMIPFVGAAAIWAPAALWLYFIDERSGAALGLAIYGLAVVSSVDNLIKPFVLHGASRLHPLLALLSILGGVSALGAIGIIVGPMIVSFLQTLLNILHRELLHFDRESRGGRPATGGEQA
ncbi:MAG: AI-2E family transporter [Pirellulaceae bacterium]|jgi:predicted PurR-regulated permease PerM|nr:AI-2E family transporter [Pirellulaceae bacterium]